MLLAGPAGWGEFSPFLEYDDAEAAAWLAAAVEQATVGWPAPVRDSVPVNVDRPGRRPRAGARARRPVGLPHREGQGRRARAVARRRPGPARGGPRRARPGRRGPRRRQRGLGRRRGGGGRSARWTAPPAGWSTSSSPAPRSRSSPRSAGGSTCRIAADESIRRADDPYGCATWTPPTSRCSRCSRSAGCAPACGSPRTSGCPSWCRRALETSVGHRRRGRAGGGAARAAVRLRAGDGAAARRRRRPGRRLLPVDGPLPVARTPPAPDPALLDAHRLRDPERARWWHDRLARTARILGVPNL